MEAVRTLKTEVGGRKSEVSDQSEV